VRGGHAQTIAGAYLPGRAYPYRATRHQLLLPDGDALVLHDDCPPVWQPSDRSVLLLHGLAGCFLSPYMQRLAGKFRDAGARAFRLDLRGAGAGMRLAKRACHGGRSDDAAAALRFIAELCPNSPTTLIGFSLGGNISLKLLGEIGSGHCGNLVAGVAVSPPVELATCCKRIQRRDNRVYERRFVRTLLRQHADRVRQTPGAVRAPESRVPRTLFELDDLMTAPINGFGNAERYYRECSSAPFVPQIARPTLILAAADDPLIPVEIFERLQLPAAVQLHIAPGGGHLGFIARRHGDADRRWMDWRLLDWVLAPA
jgi:predicted alpha/beta-fold hydrolase